MDSIQHSCRWKKSNKSEIPRGKLGSKPRLLASADIVDWSRQMGFPYADDAKFQKFVKKLDVPQLRSIWRHITTHVRPREEVENIRKQMLLAKLKMGSSKTDEKLTYIKSIEEMEASQEQTKLKTELFNIKSQLNDKVEEIKNLQSQIEEWKKEITSKKKDGQDNIRKCNLLELKNKAMENNIEKVKELHDLVLSLSCGQASVTMSSKVPTQWEQEVGMKLKSLTIGNEIDEMAKEMSECQNKLIDNPTSPVHQDKCGINLQRKLLVDVEKLHVKKAKGIESSQSFYSKKCSNITEAKEKLYQTVVQNQGETVNNELVRKIVDRKVQNIQVAEKKKSYEKIINNWKNTIDNTSLSDRKSEITKLKLEIANKRRDIDFYFHFNVENIRRKVKESQKLMRELLNNLTPVDEIITSLTSLSNAMPEEIDLFLKVPLTSTGRDLSLSSNQSQSDYFISGLLREKCKEWSAFNSLTVKLPQYDTASTAIAVIQEEKLKLEGKFLEKFHNSGIVISKIKNLNRQNVKAMAFLLNPSFTNYPLDSPEYHKYKEKYSRAIKTLIKSE